MGGFFEGGVLYLKAKIVVLECLKKAEQIEVEKCDVARDGS